MVFRTQSQNFEGWFILREKKKNLNSPNWNFSNGSSES